MRIIAGNLLKLPGSNGYRNISGPVAPYAFISYSKKDGKEHARRLATEMNRFKLSYFLDEECLVGGDIWDDEIRKMLCASKCLFVVVTKEACRSEYVHREISVAWGDQKRIVPLLADDVSPEDMPTILKPHMALPMRDRKKVRRAIKKAKRHSRGNGKIICPLADFLYNGIVGFFNREEK